MSRSRSLDYRCAPFHPARLVLAALLISPGCASIEGLRSVAANRPSLTSMWDRDQTPAVPQNDLYAQTMNSRTKSAAAQPESVATSEAEAQKADESPASSPGSAITLGTPRPLPVVVSSALAPTETKPIQEPIAREPDPSSADSRHVAAPNPSLAMARESATTTRTQSHRSSNPPRSGADDPVKLLQKAAAHVRSLENYQVKMKRMERVRGRLQPEEEILMSIRRDPKAVRFEWEDGPSKGREVIYSSAIDPRMIFVHMSGTAIALPTMKIAIDSPMVTSNSRHSIADAGLDRIIENLRKASEQPVGPSGERKDLVYHGLESVPGSATPSHRFTHRTPTNETWTVYLDQQSLLPILVYAKDASGDLIERYQYQSVRENPPELATADAFSPDRRWGEPKGLLSRLAGSTKSTNADSVAR